MRVIRFIVLLLIVIGALNWGVYGLFQMDMIQVYLGMYPAIARLVYILVGLSGLYAITFFFCKHIYKGCGCCCKKEKE
ncbi:MAG: DUF378 domain-containing protein [Chlamydiota bacterium]